MIILMAARPFLPLSTVRIIAWTVNGGSTPTIGPIISVKGEDYVRGTRPTDYCTVCHCKFYGAYCKRHHVVTKQCQSVKTCLKCQAQYTVVPDRRHKCKHAKCPVCQEWVSIQHRKCYIQSVVKDEEPEPTEEGGGCMVAPPPTLFVYADFEAMQNAGGSLSLICCVIRPAKKRPSMHAWKLMPEIGPNRMSHSYQSSCLKFARVHFAFSARGAEIGQDFPF